MATPAAYLRKSRSDDPTKEVSEDVQRAAVRDLAQRDGLDPEALVYYVDWDRSADESKAARRLAFARLVRAIEAGEHSVVYAYVPDRLYRGLESYLSLTAAARKAGTRIVTTRGAVGGSDDPMAEFADGLGALLGKLELSTAKSRAKAAYRARLERDGWAGQVPYGKKAERLSDGSLALVDDPERPVAPIIDAYVRSGHKVRAAVRVLNDELHIASPYGREWDRPSLLRVIARYEKDTGEQVRPPATVNGRREAAPTPAMFSKLLRCHCGRLLTPNRHVERRSPAHRVSVSYYCAAGNSAPDTHGRPYYVAANAVRPWIEGEAARLRAPGEEMRLAVDHAAKREAVIARRERASDLYLAGDRDKAWWQGEKANAERELSALEGARAVITLPALEWTNPVVEVNAVLRAVFEYIQLGHDLRPVRAEWTAPEWRSPD